MTLPHFATTNGSVFMDQRAHGFDVWEEPFVTLRVPKLIDLHADPFERGPEEGIDYSHWRIDRVFLLVPAQAYVGALASIVRAIPASSETGNLQPPAGDGQARERGGERRGLRGVHRGQTPARSLTAPAPGHSCGSLLLQRMPFSKPRADARARRAPGTHRRCRCRRDSAWRPRCIAATRGPSPSRTARRCCPRRARRESD